jgi:hypothetical protein
VEKVKLFQCELPFVALGSILLSVLLLFDVPFKIFIYALLVFGFWVMLPPNNITALVPIPSFPDGSLLIGFLDKLMILV